MRSGIIVVNKTNDAMINFVLTNFQAGVWELVQIKRVEVKSFKYFIILVYNDKYY